MNAVGIVQGSRMVGRSLIVALAVGSSFIVREARSQQYGHTVAIGNFNNSVSSSTRDEIAIGAPFDDWQGSATGSVTIGWRDQNGAWVYDWLDQQRLGGSLFTGASDGGLENSDRFGSSMAVGDFDGDGFRDLAIGVPKENLVDVVDAGCVHVIYGAASGPNGMPFRQATTYLTRSNAFSYTDVPAIVQAGDLFGYSLAAADLNADGKDDLAIGAPGVTIRGKANAGAVFVFFSSGNIFSSASEYTLFEGGPDSPVGTAELNDNFGTALAAGNFNGDLATNGRPLIDLAVSTPGQAVGLSSAAGSVSIFFKHPLNVDFDDANIQVIVQQNIPAGDVPEANDQFGLTLAAGNLNSTISSNARWLDDLVIGVPRETRSGLEAAGVVHVLYGSTSGITMTGNQYLTPEFFSTQNTAPQARAHFGSALAVGDFINNPNGGCQGQACNPKDLVIGEWGRNISGFNAAGRIYTLKGNLSPGAPTPSFVADGSFNTGAQYGFALAIGQLEVRTGDPGAISDILIGEPSMNRARLYFGGVDTVPAPATQKTFAWPW